jgi:uncharacterized short protein YbdD (DUF466 family)
MLDNIMKVERYIRQALRLMVGMPDYGTYVTHRQEMHPGQPVMSYEDFFWQRQAARYGGNGHMSRCC